jgi:outer membrane protein assembly factor BamD (BamD/ComL family)
LIAAALAATRLAAAVGGALLPVAPTSDVPAAPPPAPAAAPATAGSHGARSVNVQQYAIELTLLEPARSSISRGDYPAALSALDQHRREFPNGQLSQEREALRVRALWSLGHKTAALGAARAFRKRYPRSGLLSWLKGP